MPTRVRSRLRLKKKGIPVYALLAALMWPPVLAVDRDPETSGFSGFLLFGPAGFDVASNLIVEGPPVLSDVGTCWRMSCGRRFRPQESVDHYTKLLSLSGKRN